MTTEPRSLTGMERERFAIAAGSPDGLRGRATPFGVPNGRRGAIWQISEQGFPEIIEYASSVFEPGAFADWLAGENGQRVRFLFQHGDAEESWIANPMGANALPIGTITDITEKPDGVHFAATFAAHELAAAVAELCATGALNELSVCTVALEWMIRPAADGSGEKWRHVTKAELWDISAVVWGQFGLNAMVTELFRLAPNSLQAFNAEPISADNSADGEDGEGKPQGEYRERESALREREVSI